MKNPSSASAWASYRREMASASSGIRIERQFYPYRRARRISVTQLWQREGEAPDRRLVVGRPRECIGLASENHVAVNRAVASRLLADEDRHADELAADEIALDRQPSGPFGATAVVLR